ncbi:MAG: tetratricopeptide repeat protein [Rhodospirillales bacterium]
MLGLLATLEIGGAIAQPADADMRACFADQNPPAEIVRSCSRLLQAGGLPPREAARAHNQRGRMLARLGDDAAAAKDHDAAIALAPDLAWSYLLRGNHHRKQNRYDLADADYGRALKLDPGYAPAYYNRAMNRFDQGDNAEAIADFTRAIAVKPDYAEAYNNRGRAHFAEGSFERARDDHLAAMRLAPDDPLPYNNAGTAYRKLDDYPRALMAYDAALRLDPGLFVARYNRALALAEAGRHAEALAAFDQALAVEPGHFESRRWRAYVLLYLGRHAEAADALAQALARQPADNYLALWTHVARRLAGQDADGALLAQDLKALHSPGWPSPANLMFQGRIGPDELVRQARDRDPETEKNQLCEAYGFAGAHALIAGRRDDAAAWFRKAAEIRRPSFIGYIFANAELKHAGGN